MTQDLLAQASAVLSKEMARFGAAGATPAPGAPMTLTPAVQALGDAATARTGPACPVTAATVPSASPGWEQVRRQAHELLAGLLGSAASGPGGVGLPSDLQRLTGRSCPVTKAVFPLQGFDLEKDRIRRQAHEFIETLLITFSQSTGEKGLPAEDKVPMIHGAAPVPAGGEARASLKLANEESAPIDVVLYCTNLVADSGYEIPALRVTAVPRSGTIPAKGELELEVRVAIPAQSPAGTYCGLIQAMGSKYAKAVLSVDVL